MDKKERKLRQRHQELYDMPVKTFSDTREAYALKIKLIRTYGWARGKMMPNGRFNMLEKP